MRTHITSTARLCARCRRQTASSPLAPARRSISSTLLAAPRVDADPGLLLTVLEAREEIEDAATEAELEGLRAANDARIRASEDVLEAAFRGDDLEAAKREAVRLRYWVNIRDSLDAWESGKPVVLEH
ncbi:hypothetical protein VdG1_01368 [Verticillium dahliae VDG1]|nr:hypothetical protein VdG1_01368 [Verticillium dahliae VDG1]